MKSEKVKLIIPFIIITVLLGIPFLLLHLRAEVPGESVEKSVKGTTTVELTSVADAYLDNLFPDTNFGIAESIAKTGYTNDEFGFANRAVFKFDLSSIPSNATVTSATMSVKVYGSKFPANCYGTPTMLWMGSLNSSWGESTITWNNHPVNSNPIPVNIACIYGYQDTDLTGYVIGWVENPSTNHGLIILGTESGSMWLRQIYTREAGGTLVPKLTVTYSTPEPVSAPPSPPDPTENNENSNNNNSESTDDTNVTETGDSGTQDVVDNTVLPPALTLVTKNDEEIEPPIAEAIEVDDDDTIVISGESIANTTIVVEVGGETYKVTSDNDGLWSVTLDVTNIDIGEYIVWGTAVSSEEEKSEKVELFSLEKVGDKIASVEKEDKNNMWQYLLLILFSLVLPAGGGLYYYFLVYKKKKNGSEKKDLRS